MIPTYILELAQRLRADHYQRQYAGQLMPPWDSISFERQQKWIQLATVAFQFFDEYVERG